MTRQLRRETLLIAILLAGAWCNDAQSQTNATKVNEQPRPQPRARRDFLFNYGVVVDGLERNVSARVWVPIPRSDECQTVRIIREDLPGKGTFATETKYGNEILFVDANTGNARELKLNLMFRVTRFSLSKGIGVEPATREEASLFVKPDAKVPTDGKPLDLVKGRTLSGGPQRKCRSLYDVVFDFMRYSKEGTGWGQGDVNWVCDHGYGNCSDFHSLFISLARSQSIPAKFEIGFLLPDERGRGDITGYHCWAKFLDEDNQWEPVDISEAKKHPELRDFCFGNLTENRLMMTVGRDVTLVPKQNGAPLNFFVYPYVEISGHAYPAQKIKFSFSYADLDAQRD